MKDNPPVGDKSKEGGFNQEIEELNNLIDMWEASLEAVKGGAILGPKTDVQKEEVQKKIDAAKARLRELGVQR